MLKQIPTLIMMLSVSTSFAADDFNAEEFVETKCVGCHDSSLYTRSNRRVDSLARLDAQIRMCDANLGIKLFDDEVTAIVEYLNETYYKFDR